MEWNEGEFFVRRMEVGMLRNGIKKFELLNLIEKLVKNKVPFKYVSFKKDMGRFGELEYIYIEYLDNNSLQTIYVDGRTNNTAQKALFELLEMNYPGESDNITLEFPKVDSEKEKELK